MARSVPKRLRREPLLEAVWEMRFTSDRPPVSDLLPGLVYKALGDQYPKLVRLPAANIPHPIADHEEAFRFMPTLRLEGDPFFIQIGERVVSLNCRRPYAGWSEFSTRIVELAAALRETGLLSSPERFSLKYIDLVELDGPPSLSYLEVSTLVGGRDLGERPVHLRTEIEEEGFVHVLQIASPAEVRLSEGETQRGVLVDIDSIRKAGAEDFWATLDENVNKAHELSKALFFSLLSDETLKQLEPEY